MKLIISLVVIIAVLLVLLFRTLSSPKHKSGNTRSRRNTVRREPVLRSGSSAKRKASMPKKTVKKEVDTYTVEDELESADDILGLNASVQNKSSSVGDKISTDNKVATAEVSNVNTHQSANLEGAIKKTTAPGPIITLYVKAADGSCYGGYELLQALLSNGLRFGKHQIFHCYDSGNTDGDILFSCASLLAPGTFELAKMGGFTTSGLAFFLESEFAGDPKAAFDSLLHTIDGIVEDLGGSVYDSSNNIFTTDTLVNLHSQIDQYVTSCQTQDLFAGEYS